MFVQNRVKEIRKLITPDCWSHCPGKENPADIPSRRLTPLELSVNTLWRCGPAWLGDSAPGDLAEVEETSLPEECLIELKSTDPQSTHGLLTTEPTASLSQVMDCEKFGSMERLIHTTSLVVQFCWKLLDGIHGNLTQDYTNSKAEAELLWILECQRMISTDKNFRHWQQQLDLFQDERGVWRCGGRIQNAAVPYATKHPILLPKSHHITVLLVRQAHNRVLHNGVKDSDGAPFQVLDSPGKESRQDHYSSMQHLQET